MLQSKFKPVKFTCRQRTQLLTDLFQSVAAALAVGKCPMGSRILGCVYDCMAHHCNNCVNASKWTRGPSQAWKEDVHAIRDVYNLRHAQALACIYMSALEDAVHGLNTHKSEV